MDSSNTSFALQLLLATAVLLIWMFVCLWIIACLGTSLKVLRKEVTKVVGAPRAEALWAARVLKFELAACLCLTLSCTTLWWIPYKILLWAYGQPVADEEFLLPLIIAHRFNMLIKALSAAVLSGLLWHPQAPVTLQPPPSLQIQIHGQQEMESPRWSRKVDELAHRAVSLQSLLRFWKDLGQVMPSFDPLRSTTNDVVRMAIIPLSRDAGGGGRSLAAAWSDDQPLRAKCMVTHNWSNLFLHLLAGILADALDEPYYEKVAAKLLTETGLEELEAAIADVEKTAYWVCAFSINQHACICDSFGSPPADEAGQKQRQENRRDSVSGALYPVCNCHQPKVFNDEPALCEMNKFNSMMRHLAKLDESFSHLVIADQHFQVFTRAWCIAEIVESEVSQIPKRIMLHSESSLDNHYQSLSCIDVKDCYASRTQDREMILAGISDLATFNAQLQWAIFGTKGLLSKWVDGPGRAALVARILRRIEGRPVLSPG